MTDGVTREPLRFSVIVASWQRPFWLKRCLRALGQLDYPAFEIIVVADAAALTGIDGENLKKVPFDEANLSRARNAGIAVAGGDVCAFIDDDTVPEPMWLAHFEDAFRRTGADAAVGYVRGRNGISFQSRIQSVDCEAETHAEPHSGVEPRIPILLEGRALKLVGTNMAVRRDVLAAVGGFDEMYRYFLEDTDLSIRIAAAGYTSAIAPMAQVHHAFASSPRRTKLRTPVDLQDIGRSSALFLRRHFSGDHQAILARIERRERTRLLRHMVRGTCEPSDVGRILAGLKAGWDAGQKETLGHIDRTMNLAENDFLPFPALPSGHKILFSRLFSRHKRLREAEKIAEIGDRVSLFSFSLTPVRQHLRYTPKGVWLQTGGQFGKSDRDQKFLRWCRFAERSAEEVGRVANVRGIGNN